MCMPASGHEHGSVGIGTGAGADTTWSGASGMWQIYVLLHAGLDTCE